MMRIFAIQSFDVNSHRGMGREGLEKLTHEFAIEGAYFRLRKFCPKDQKRPAGNIHRNPRKGLVHRQKHIPKTGDSGHVAQRLAHRLTERYAGILDRMMLIDMKIARRADFDINQRVVRKLFQHMVEKADPSRNSGHPGAVEIDADLDAGFLGLARNGAFAHGWPEVLMGGFLNHFKATGS